MSEVEDINLPSYGMDISVAGGLSVAGMPSVAAWLCKCCGWVKHFHHHDSGRRNIRLHEGYVMCSGMSCPSRYYSTFHLVLPMLYNLYLPPVSSLVCSTGIIVYSCRPREGDEPSWADPLRCGTSSSLPITTTPSTTFLALHTTISL